jgi:hypothetical protein
VWAPRRGLAAPSALMRDARTQGWRGVRGALRSRIRRGCVLCQLASPHHSGSKRGRLRVCGDAATPYLKGASWESARSRLPRSRLRSRLWARILSRSSASPQRMLRGGVRLSCRAVGPRHRPRSSPTSFRQRPTRRARPPGSSTSSSRKARETASDLRWPTRSRPGSGAASAKRGDVAQPTPRGVRCALSGKCPSPTVGLGTEAAASTASERRRRVPTREGNDRIENVFDRVVLGEVRVGAGL